MEKKKPTPTMEPTLPPFSNEAEQGVLGCMILDPSECIPIAQNVIGNADMFYDLRHEELYSALGELLAKGGLLDAIGLQQGLKDRNSLEACGGMPYIASLMNVVPSSANIDYYLAIVKEKFTLRQIIKVCHRATEWIYKSEGDVANIISEFQKAVMEIDPTIKGSEDIDIKELMDRVSFRIESYAATGSKTKGLMTGFYDLDRVFNGMKVGQLIILGARPSMGKSSLALNFVEYVAIVQREPCAFFSMEMEAEELGERLVASRAEIDGEIIQRGEATDADFAKMSNVIATIAKSPIHICDRGGMTFPFFRAKLRKMVAKHKIRLVIIDYLQLFAVSQKENRSIEIGAITTGLKALAKELKVTIICLSQLNRDLEKENRRPRLSDLRDSGGIEQDADKIVLLSEEVEEPKPKKKKAKGEKEEKAEPKEERDPNRPIIIADVPKNRGGKRGIVRLMFNKPFTRFETVSRFENGEADFTPTEPRLFEAQSEYP